MDTLRKQQSDSGDNEKETNDFQQRLERQEESIKDLQAAVDAQTELLRAIADKLDIGKWSGVIMGGAGEGIRQCSVWIGRLCL